MCRAASRSSLVQRRTVRSKVVGDAIRSAGAGHRPQLGPAHVAPVAVLLRVDVGRLQLVDRARPAPDARGLRAVGVSLARAEPEPADVRDRRRQLEAQPEAGQRDVPRPSGVDRPLQPHPAVDARPPVGRHHREIGRRRRRPHHHDERVAVALHRAHRVRRPDRARARTSAGPPARRARRGRCRWWRATDPAPGRARPPSPKPAKPPRESNRSGSGAGADADAGDRQPAAPAPNASSCPAGAHSWSAASTARTVSHTSPVPARGTRRQRHVHRRAGGAPQGPTTAHAQRAGLVDAPPTRRRHATGRRTRACSSPARRRRRDVERDRREHRLQLGQPRRGRAVGEDQPVDARSCRRAAARRSRRRRRTVPSGARRMPWSIHSQMNPPMQRGYFSNSCWYSSRPPGPLPIACAYSHCTNGIDRGGARRARRPRSIGSSPRPIWSTSSCGGVHAAVDVDVAAVPVALVVDRAARVAWCAPARP